MQTQNGITRQSVETLRAFEAFCLFLRLPASERTVAQVARRPGRTGGTTGDFRIAALREAEVAELLELRQSVRLLTLRRAMAALNVGLPEDAHEIADGVPELIGPDSPPLRTRSMNLQSGEPTAPPAAHAAAG